MKSTISAIVYCTVSMYELCDAPDGNYDHPRGATQLVRTTIGVVIVFIEYCV